MGITVESRRGKKKKTLPADGWRQSAMDGEQYGDGQSPKNQSSYGRSVNYRNPKEGINSLAEEGIGDSGDFFLNRNPDAHSAKSNQYKGKEKALSIGRPTNVNEINMQEKVRMRCGKGMGQGLECVQEAINDIVRSGLHMTQPVTCDLEVEGLIVWAVSNVVGQENIDADNSCMDFMISLSYVETKERTLPIHAAISEARGTGEGNAEGMKGGKKVRKWKREAKESARIQSAPTLGIGFLGKRKVKGVGVNDQHKEGTMKRIRCSNDKIMAEAGVQPRQDQ